MIPRMPRWQSYVAATTDPIFTPEQCKMIIDAGHQCAPEKAKVGGGKGLLLPISENNKSPPLNSDGSDNKQVIDIFLTGFCPS